MYCGYMYLYAISQSIHIGTANSYFKQQIVVVSLIIHPYRSSYFAVPVVYIYLYIRNGIKLFTCEQ